MIIWGKIKKGDKTVQQHILEYGGQHEFMDALLALCRALDLESPIMLPKHHSELSTYHRTAFVPGDFTEKVTFSRFEIELLDNSAPTKSRDIRNDFSI